MKTKNCIKRFLLITSLLLSNAASFAQINLNQRATLMMEPGDTIIRIIWDKYTLQHVAFYIVEEINNAIPAGIDTANLDALQDVMQFPLTAVLQNEFYLTTESGTPTFFYDLPIFPDQSTYLKKFRIKLIFDNFSTAYSTEVGITEYAGQEAYYASLAAGPCPSLTSPPFGWVPTGLTSSAVANCCLIISQQWTEICSVPSSVCSSNNQTDCTPMCHCIFCVFCAHTCSNHLSGPNGGCVGWFGNCNPGGATAWIITSVYQLNFTASSSASTYCEGQTIQLFGQGVNVTGVPAPSFSWTGPNGFSSNLQNPTIPNSTPSNSGIYYVTISIPGCTQYFQVNITVKQGVHVNAPITVCTGGQVHLSVTPLSSTATYHWTGPNGFNSNVANPVFSASSSANSGTYTLTVVDPPCTFTTTTTVNVTPPFPPFMLSGPNNTCKNNITISIPSTISSNNTLSEIHWSDGIFNGIPNTIGSYTMSQDFQSITITNWGSFTSGTISVFLNINGCYTQGYLLIHKCCFADPFFSDGNISSYFPELTSINLYNNGVITQPLVNPGYRLAFNGTVYIDQNVEFRDCPNLMCGPDAKIVVKSGVTLKLSNSNTTPQNSSFLYQTVLYAKCDTMWDGIYIEPGGHLIVTSANNLRTTISDAKNGVVSMAGGDYKILNSQFDRNNKDIVVQPFLGNHTGYVSGTIFSSTGSTLLPYNDYSINWWSPGKPGLTRTSTGIDVDHVNKIDLGDPSSNRNTFVNMDFGIKSSYSFLTVINNSFNKISGSWSYGNGRAIWIKNGNTTNTPSVIGSNTIPNANDFNDCFIGVFAESNLSLFCRNNIFTSLNNINNPNSTQILLQNCGQSACHVNSNTFYLHNYGIRLANTVSSLSYPAGSIKIYDNHFLPLSGSNAQSRTAICMGNANLTKVNVEIYNNHDIKNTTTGIELSGQEGVNVHDNDITFLNQGIYLGGIGIRALNCKNLSLKWNTVTMNAQVTASNSEGISIQNCWNDPMGGIISHNTITKCSVGLRARWNCSQSTFACNTMDRCLKGFYFGVPPTSVNPAQPATIGNQIFYNNGSMITFGPTANQWLNMPSVSTPRITGYVSPSTWRYNGPILGTSYSPNPSSVNSNLLLSPSSVSNSTMCSQYYYSFPNQNLSEVSSDLREEIFGPIIRDEITYETMQEENKYLANYYAYQCFSEHPELLHLDSQTDDLFHDYYETLVHTNFGELESVREKIARENYLSAAETNEFIVSGNEQETYQRTVNAIYLNTWAEDQYILNRDQEVLLEPIAFMNPLVGGPAVYGARVLLGINPEESDGDPQFRIGGTKDNNQKTSSEIPEKIIFGIIYPNPNDGKMTLEYSLPEGKKASLEIYSLTGVSYVSKNLPSGTGVLKINETGLSPGFYLYDIIVDKISIEHGKLSIIKQ